MLLREVASDWSAYQHEAEHHFNPQATVPHWRQYMAERRACSEVTRLRYKPRTVRYGQHPREQVDIFIPDRVEATATIVYFHGGYWRMGDKDASSLIAEPFLRAGIPVMVPNYALCPDVSLEQVVDSAMGFLRWAHARSEDYGSPASLLVCGHSAGAHLSAFAMTREWLPEGLDPILMFRGFALFGGIFDLRPTLWTSVNGELGLDHDTAVSLSPILRTIHSSSPVIVAAGTLEAPGWLEQSRRMFRRLASLDLPVEWFDLPGENHHSPILRQVQPEYPVTQRMIDLAKGNT